MAKAGAEISPPLGRPLTEADIRIIMADAVERKRLAAASSPNGDWKPGPVCAAKPKPVASAEPAPPQPSGAAGRPWFLPPRR